MIINRLPMILQDKQMSIRELARQTNITYTTIQAIYHMERRSIQFTVLEAICRALDVQPGELFVFQPTDTWSGDNLSPSLTDEPPIARLPLPKTGTQRPPLTGEDWKYW